MTSEQLKHFLQFYCFLFISFQQNWKAFMHSLLCLSVCTRSSSLLYFFECLEWINVIQIYRLIFYFENTVYRINFVPQLFAYLANHHCISFWIKSKYFIFLAHFFCSTVIHLIFFSSSFTQQKGSFYNSQSHIKFHPYL